MDAEVEGHAGAIDCRLATLGYAVMQGEPEVVSWLGAPLCDRSLHAFFLRGLFLAAQEESKSSGETVSPDWQQLTHHFIAWFRTHEWVQGVLFTESNLPGM